MWRLAAAALAEAARGEAEWVAVLVARRWSIRVVTGVPSAPSGVCPIRAGAPHPFALALDRPGFSLLALASAFSVSTRRGLLSMSDLGAAVALCGRWAFGMRACAADSAVVA